MIWFDYVKENPTTLTLKTGHYSNVAHRGFSLEKRKMEISSNQLIVNIFKELYELFKAFILSQ